MANLKNAHITPQRNLLLYSLLLIFTPFILLQNYLQDFIGNLSHSVFMVGVFEIPYSLLVFIAVIILVAIKTWNHFNKTNIIAWVIVFVFWFIGQQTSDFYLNSKYYDLQNNWHYVAYGLFVVVAYNTLSQKINKTAHLIFAIFIRALLISTFDEAIQILLTNRVFDVSDIGKDIWGTVAALIVLFIGYKNPEIIKNGWKISQPKIKDYYNNPLSIIVLLSIFTYILLFISSLLTDKRYIINIVLITIFIFLIIFFFIHQMRTKPGKRMVWIVIAILFLAQSISFISNFNKQITFNKQGITIYKGIPLPYFDVMFFENGGFRFVDKKLDFNQGDIMFFFEKTSNILLIGSGKEDKGRLGFPEDLSSQFMYNTIQKKPIQIIILPTSKACDTYNRLKKEGKKVTFILHNTN